MGVVSVPIYLACQNLLALFLVSVERLLLQPLALLQYAQVHDRNPYHFAATPLIFSAVLMPDKPSIPNMRGIIVPMSIWGNFTG